MPGRTVSSPGRALAAAAAKARTSGACYTQGSWAAQEACLRTSWEACCPHLLCDRRVLQLAQRLAVEEHGQAGHAHGQVVNVWGKGRGLAQQTVRHHLHTAGMAEQAACQAAYWHNSHAPACRALLLGWTGKGDGAAWQSAAGRIGLGKRHRSNAS